MPRPPFRAFRVLHSGLDSWTLALCDQACCARATLATLRPKGWRLLLEQQRPPPGALRAARSPGYPDKQPS